MDSQDHKQLVPAGWYPDPSGSGKPKWWDGTGWAEEEWDARSGNPPVGPPLNGGRPLLGSQIRLYGPFLWTLLSVPVIMIGLDLVTKISVPGYRDGSKMADPGLVMVAGLFIIVTFVVSYVLMVVMAYRDWRWLARAGVVRPFHWAWGFLPTVYVIGRTVIVRKVAPATSSFPIAIVIALTALDRINSSW
ncbi:DUF2510 domain-containing protein [Arthrobacter bambusae]|uniref:DUF2510 domain-containing protein n=1 Tax=Arthrobacter bambusae TaxID=1338426 RepID=A0AAW8DIG4_9MICC|nr:DUF2510 domain-containing protein [Arthrobacter bambusae]MDP9904608.1 hypothetical protein [Arthrobacter bambusae]MDQ0129424.1 hypothetical protein [Arthrobacter bambusae]MDQ0180963.1 hypothetical protein [Arthrobacter bambusae]